MPYTDCTAAPVGRHCTREALARRQTDMRSPDSWSQQAHARCTVQQVQHACVVARRASRCARGRLFMSTNSAAACEGVQAARCACESPKPLAHRLARSAAAARKLQLQVSKSTVGGRRPLRRLPGRSASRIQRRRRPQPSCSRETASAGSGILRLKSASQHSSPTVRPRVCANDECCGADGLVVVGGGAFGHVWPMGAARRGLTGPSAASDG